MFIGVAWAWGLSLRSQVAVARTAYFMLEPQQQSKVPEPQQERSGRSWGFSLRDPRVEHPSASDRVGCARRVDGDVLSELERVGVGLGPAGAAGTTRNLSNTSLEIKVR